MKRRSCEQQLGFSLRATAGLPFPVSPRRIRRVARRLLAGCSRPSFQTLGYAEKVAMLAELRRHYRRALREMRGVRIAAAVFAGTPMGRRLHRILDNLSSQISMEQTPLCG